MKRNLLDVKDEVERYGKLINAPEIYFPTYGFSKDGAHPHIEVDDLDQLFYVIIERGEVLKRDLALDTNDLLFRIFRDITFSMASDYEVKNRVENEDFRRLLFSKQLELLSILDKSWKQKRQREIADVLDVNPYSDEV